MFPIDTDYSTTKYSELEEEEKKIQRAKEWHLKMAKMNFTPQLTEAIGSEILARMKKFDAWDGIENGVGYRPGNLMDQSYALFTRKISWEKNNEKFRDFLVIRVEFRDKNSALIARVAEVLTRDRLDKDGSGAFRVQEKVYPDGKRTDISFPSALTNSKPSSEKDSWFSWSLFSSGPSYEVDPDLGLSPAQVERIGRLFRGEAIEHPNGKYIVKKY